MYGSITPPEWCRNIIFGGLGPWTNGARAWNESGSNAWLLVSANYARSGYQGCPLYFLGGWITLPVRDEGGQWWDFSWISCRLCDHFILDRCRFVGDYGPCRCGLDSPTHFPKLYAVGEGVEPDWRLGETGFERWFGGDQYLTNVNQLKRNICAFPSDSPAKRRLED